MLAWASQRSTRAAAARSQRGRLRRTEGVRRLREHSAHARVIGAGSRSRRGTYSSTHVRAPPSSQPRYNWGCGGGGRLLLSSTQGGAGQGSRASGGQHCPVPHHSWCRAAEWRGLFPFRAAAGNIASSLWLSPGATHCCTAAQASQPLEFIVKMDAEKMITGGNVRATITSTRYVAIPPDPYFAWRRQKLDHGHGACRNKEVTASTTTSICFLGPRCPISVSAPASACATSSAPLAAAETVASWLLVHCASCRDTLRPRHCARVWWYYAML